jgi:hypothetical protein
MYPQILPRFSNSIVLANVENRCWEQLGCAGYRIARFSVAPPGLIILFCGNSPQKNKFEPQVCTGQLSSIKKSVHPP